MTSEKFSRREFQENSENNKLKGKFFPALFDVVITDYELECILPTMRKLLDRFIDSESDQVGNGLAKIAGGVSYPIPLTDYIRILIRSSAILGGKRTAELLFSWIKGEPVKYHKIYILGGISIDNPLKIQEGLEIVQFQPSSKKMSRFVPAMSSELLFMQKAIGGVELSIEYEFRPALYHPLKGEVGINKPKFTKNSGFINNLPIDGLCKAMSLTSNCCVRWRYEYIDFGDVKDFIVEPLDDLSSSNIPLIFDSTNYTQENFEQTRDRYHNLEAKIESNLDLDTAIKRWINSKESNYSITDSFIEIRIALESLYLNKNNSELRFRLASYGAWHLGQCFEQRKKIFKTLLDTYNLASNAVHGENIKCNCKNKTLLEKAQEICREGILKRLSDDEKPEWDDLILGFKSELHKYN
ncbi:MAG: hypothetical protein OXC02_01150 [Rhodobacteraceae bacterium]|nr:hypothetical protein [Paracoccaceae bacterium]